MTQEEYNAFQNAPELNMLSKLLQNYGLEGLDSGSFPGVVEGQHPIGGVRPPEGLQRLIKLLQDEVTRTGDPSPFHGESLYQGERGTTSAHENMDSIIEEYEHSSILSELMQTMGVGGLTGEILGPMQGDEQSILGGLTGEMTPSLEERKANIKKFPSFESRGVERFTVPITKDDGSVIEESRSMQHWLQDYPYLEKRTSLGGDY